MASGLLVLGAISCANLGGLTGNGGSPDARALDDATTPKADAPTSRDSGKPADASTRKDAARDAVADTGSDSLDAGVEASCSPNIPGANFCESIPTFGSAVQVVDGYPYEFCGLPFLVWNATSAVSENVAVPPWPVTTQVMLFVAWSPDALHVYFEVTQSDYFSLGTDNALPYKADAVELFVAGSASLHGPTDPGAPDADTDTVHVIAVPPTLDGGPGGAAVWAYTHPLETLAPGKEVATRRTATGYAVELEIAANTYLFTTFAATHQIGFDFGVDAYETPVTDGGPQWFQGFYMDRPDAGAGCKAPYCNDRTWCVPSLQGL